MGLYNEFADPERVVEGRPGNSIAHGWSPIASHYLEVELQPGESRDFIFLLGYVENKQEAKFEEREESLHEAFKQSVPSSPIINKVKAKAMISAFDTTAKVDAAFAELKAYWDRLLDIYVVKTDEEKLDRMVNNILQSISYLIGEERKILSIASQAGDEVTVSMMSDYLKEQEKLVWMLTAYNSK